MVQRALAIALSAVVVLAAGCGLGGPRYVPIEQLAFETERFEGQVVETSGFVREFTEAEATARHMVLEDADHNRVELLPPDAAEPHVGQPVTVTGEFSFEPDRGRAIEVTDVRPARGADG